VSDRSPIWLRVVLHAERVVGTRVESAFHSDLYFDLVTGARRSQERLTALSEGISRRIIHLANLPAGTDIRRVRAQLARIERRLVELSKQLDDQAASLDRRSSKLEFQAAKPDRPTSNLDIRSEHD
jgi:hypothetical protein